MSPGKKLTRGHGRMIAGVCAGIAAYWNVPVKNVRIGYVIVSLLSAAFPGVLVYLILWVIMPAERA